MCLWYRNIFLHFSHFKEAMNNNFHSKFSTFIFNIFFWILFKFSFIYFQLFQKFNTNQNFLILTYFSFIQYLTRHSATYFKIDYSKIHPIKFFHYSYKKIVTYHSAITSHSQIYPKRALPTISSIQKRKTIPNPIGHLWFGRMKWSGQAHAALCQGPDPPASYSAKYW